MAEDAVAQRINALSGGSPLPQAAMSTIAKRLLGPGLADRYGDVIGLRPTGAQDVARDLAIGTLSGDPFKADALKAQVVKNFNEEKRREEDQTLQREAGARDQLNGFFNLLEQGKKVPKDLRQDFFKEGLAKLGVEATSPLFVKILTNYEKFGSVYDALGDPDVRRMADEDPLTAVERLMDMGHDGAAALQVAQSVQQMKRYRADTQNIISRNVKLQRELDNPDERGRNSFIARMAGRTVKDRLGRTRVISPDEIMQMADRFFPATGAGIPQDNPDVVPPAVPEPAGIPQAAPEAAVPAAEAGKQKVRRLTGTVTRVE